MIQSMPSRLATQSAASTYEHAVVIGGSIAGLIAARVLSEHFERVTVIERDPVPTNGEFRKGVPQARHPHALLLRGQMILEQLFPGLIADLRAAGAVAFNMGLDMPINMFGRWLPQYESELIGTSCSRPMLEGAIRSRLAMYPNVTFQHEAEASELCIDPVCGCVTGLVMRHRNGGGNTPELLTANLVVDASGRDSKAPEWLSALGYPAPQELTVNAFPGYATRIYERPADFDGDWKGMMIQPMPPANKRGGVILPMEGKRWHVTMIGMGGDYPPTDEQGFIEFARSLSSPMLYDAIKHARPLTSISGYRRAENRLRRYDQLSQFLDGFLVFGDAVYAFNPIYGQGMTVAALGGMALDACLHEQRKLYSADDLNGLAMRFQKDLGKVIAFPWQMATHEDMRWPTTEGVQQLDAATRMIQRYMNQVMQAVTRNADVTKAFHHVMHMVEPPTKLMSPRVMFRVFKTNLAGRFSKS